MSMNADRDEFGQLCRLLKLKRHELPPPRYFNEFSGQVISRLRASATEDQSQSLAKLLSQSAWMRQLWRAIEQRPAMAGICTAALCGLLVVGVFLTDSATQPPSITAEAMTKDIPPTLELVGQPQLAVAGGAPSTSLFGSSTNPAMPLPAGPSMFGELPRLGAPQRVNGMPIPVGNR